MDYKIVLPIIEHSEGYKNILHVKSSSCESQKDALETMASYFKKEFRYDHLQYCKSEHSDDCFGVLFCETAMDLVKDTDHFPSRVIGGACFRKKSIDDYFLDWIWFHPFARNRGQLHKTWPIFIDKFGEFGLTKPLSAHMEKFLAKYAKQSH